MTQIATIGSGYLSGLVYDFTDGNLYAITNDFTNTGHSFFEQISPTTGAVTQVLDLGLGFDGLFTSGLTYDTANGLFYTVAADSNGISRQLDSIALTGGIVTQIALLGDGSTQFNGGIVFDPSTGALIGISTDTAGGSVLLQINLQGQIPGGNADSPFGQGFTNSGLTLVSSSVPEPSAVIPLGLLFTAAGFWRLTKKGNPQ